MIDLKIIALIIVINIVYVSMHTIRLIFVMKGYRYYAVLLSMVEVCIYLIGLNIVLDNIDRPINLLAYCIGFGTGIFLGSKIEEWLALGYVTMQVIVDSESTDLPNILRQRGYGVTSWIADGRDGKRMVMQVLAKRNNEKKFYHLIEELAPKAFVISHEPKFFRGGFWTKRL